MKKTDLLLTLPLIALDQIIKAFVRRMPEGSVYFELPGLVSLTHVTNTGAAFSLFSGNQAMLLLISAGLLLILTAYLFRALRMTRVARAAAICLLAGGLGNMIDRLLLGGVTDYIRLIPIRFPVFNFADILVTGSIFALLLLMLAGRLETRNTEDVNEPDS